MRAYSHICMPAQMDRIQIVMLRRLCHPHPLHEHGDNLRVGGLAPGRVERVAEESVHAARLGRVHRALHRMADETLHVLRRRAEALRDGRIQPSAHSEHARLG